jgi:hypothetical protein
VEFIPLKAGLLNLQPYNQITTSPTPIPQLSALQHPNFNPKWISFVISKNLFANELNFNHLI